MKDVSSHRARGFVHVIIFFLKKATVILKFLFYSAAQNSIA